jgi:3-deoxy-7-phosphoheptulonate synthase
MLIVMKPGATETQITEVLDKIKGLGLQGHPMPGQERTAIGITGNQGPVPKEAFGSLAGVAQTISVSQPYKLVSREMQGESTRVRVGDQEVGGGLFHVMAGPCSVESREQIFRAAEAVAQAGATFLRGGAFKPRTSPYAFQGLKEEGLRYLAEARERTGLQVVTEVKDTETLELVAHYADVLQVGARNMQNYSLLEAIGKVDRPVLLKRGMSATVKEVLMAAEYIFSNGNQRVILCERGIRTYETATRNTFDLGGMAVLRSMTHLPVIADPSHGIGIRSLVPSMARAAAAVGCDGLIVEVHPEPEVALSDGQQSLTPEEFEQMMHELKAILPVVQQTLAPTSFCKN